MWFFKLSGSQWPGKPLLVWVKCKWGAAEEMSAASCPGKHCVSRAHLCGGKSIYTAHQNHLLLELD